MKTKPLVAMATAREISNNVMTQPLPELFVRGARFFYSVFHLPRAQRVCSVTKQTFQK
jgi:hypothetical protein